MLAAIALIVPAGLAPVGSPGLAGRIALWREEQSVWQCSAVQVGDRSRPCSTEDDILRRVAIAGSYYDLGLEYGRIVSENKLNWWWTRPGEAKLALVKACEGAIAAHAPGFLEEIRGMADACQTDYDLILSNMIVTWSAQSACNVVAVAGKQCRNGRTVFARNHDFEDADREWVTCFRTSPKNGLRSIGFGFADPGRYDGINEAGLAMAGAAIWYRHTPQPGLRMNVVTRWVLDTFADTPSAVAYLQRIPHHEGIAYLVADTTGCIARVEAAPEGVDVAFTNDGMLAAINLFQSHKMAHLECAPGRENIVYRHSRRIPAWYDAHMGRIDLDAAKRLCSDHEMGLCDHGVGRPEPFGTIYSWVAELGTGAIHVAHGRPCENEYEVFELETA